MQRLSMARKGSHALNNLTAHAARECSLHRPLPQKLQHSIHGCSRSRGTGHRLKPAHCSRKCAAARLRRIARGMAMRRVTWRMSDRRRVCSTPAIATVLANSNTPLALCQAALVTSPQASRWCRASVIGPFAFLAALAQIRGVAESSRLILFKAPDATAAIPGHTIIAHIPVHDVQCCSS